MSQAPNNYYLNNPLIHRDRKLKTSGSEWVRKFCCQDVKPLIICRGPIRKEAMDVFDEMGIDSYGILLSEKDSITYTNALAPELRKLTDPGRVHRVPDYSGADKEERKQRIQQIIQIANDNGYNSIFTGYGFMAEDEEMVRSMEQAGLNFIGPCSKTVHDAGLKDEAKRTALKVGVSVTPGIDNATTLTVLSKYPDLTSLSQVCKDKGLDVDESLFASVETSLEHKAEAVLNASLDKGIDLFTIEELGLVLAGKVAELYEGWPSNRIRLKAISGGGGKGQRILQAPDDYKGSAEEKIKSAVSKVPELVLEILNEVKCNGVGDNKNVLAELNIESTRHQEIQVVGNGEWCITMGGRDCSLQMHEQKLLEISVTTEELLGAIQKAEKEGKDAELETLRKDLVILEKMEEEASRFGLAVGLDSVSTFECIVDGDNHFFMEMNTRIQVEHRVTELCYKLQFSNPQNPSEFFIADSLVEVMVLLARHKLELPKPTRLVREPASVEARLNATNQALQPHAGGVIERWSNCTEGEVRDDQGICMRNPDTDVFMKYHLAGAYDSNIALLLTVGNTRLESFLKLSEVIRTTNLRGKDLSTNLDFHYGLINWIIGQNINARPSTRFIVPYLTAVGHLKNCSNDIDLKLSYHQIRGKYIDHAGDSKLAFVKVLDRKAGLILRPLEALFNNPHQLSGWLSLNRNSFRKGKGKFQWLKNPIEVLADLYRFLNMNYIAGKPAANMIWKHDNELLQTANSFYDSLKQSLGLFSFSEIDAAIAEDAPEGFSDEKWLTVQSAHLGYQAGTELLSVLPFLAEQTGFFELRVNDDLSISIPYTLSERTFQEKMAKVLAPPPVAASDEVLSESGGMFYPREAPGMDVFLQEGAHFNKGDPLYIIEVMKMFNKVYAPFSGTVKKILIGGDGVIVKKGQPIFKIEADEIVVTETSEEIKKRKHHFTEKFLGYIN
ncbi:MAG: acetyl/propionyl-CoA carboxylase alpha subunit [Gammaproteobacteria bacterium]